MIIDTEILHIKQAFSPTLFYHIKQSIFEKGFPWYFLEDTGVKGVIDNPSFSSLLFQHNHRILPVSHMIEAGFMTMLDISGITIKELIRIRTGLIIKTKETSINTPHIDFNKPHLTALVYLTTSNAPTYLYNNFYDYNSGVSTYDYMLNNFKDSMQIEELVPCVENTAIIFNGNRYHASSTPTDVARRITLNLNFIP